MGLELHRRHLLGLGIGLVPGLQRLARAAPAPPEGGDAFEVLDWKLEGSPDLARRAVVLVPRDLPGGVRASVLVLLHGLGETTNESLGVRAWIDRYGLVTSHERLVRPPVAAETRRGDLPDDRARAINEDLERRAYQGRTIVVCPFTPNVARLPDTRQALDRYAAWIADVLLPAVRSRTPADPAPARTGIDGCSLGGFIGLEVFLRKPEMFGAWGGVQSAFGEAHAGAYASKIADTIRRVGPRRLHVETSTKDPFFRANTALSRELRKRDVPHDLAVLPGPHDQPWLREAGTLEMLLWHDRALRGTG